MLMSHMKLKKWSVTQLFTTEFVIPCWDCCPSTQIHSESFGLYVLQCLWRRIPFEHQERRRQSISVMSAFMIKSRSYPSIGFVLSSLILSDGWGLHGKVLIVGVFCDLNDIRGNEWLYCFDASGSVLGCDDRSRALCLCSACMHLLAHESSSTSLILSTPAVIESCVLN
jgi:hypothetical protein